MLFDPFDKSVKFQKAVGAQENCGSRYHCRSSLSPQSSVIYRSIIQVARMLWSLHARYWSSGQESVRMTREDWIEDRAHPAYCIHTPAGPSSISCILGRVRT